MWVGGEGGVCVGGGGGGEVFRRVHDRWRGVGVLGRWGVGGGGETCNLTYYCFPEAHTLLISGKNSFERVVSYCERWLCLETYCFLLRYMAFVFELVVNVSCCD